MTQRIERSPPAYRRLHAEAMAASVDEEDVGVRRTRQAIAAITTEYAARRQDEAKARRNATAAALLMFRSFKGSVLLSREAAVRLADGMLAGELDILARGLRSEVKTVTKAAVASEAVDGIEASRRALAAMASSPYRGAATEATSVRRAGEAAKGYVRAWREKLDEAIRRRGARGSNPGYAFEDAAAAVDHKVQTALATEVSNALNLEHNVRVREILEDMPREVKATLYLRWDATLDSRTCETCEANHGKTVPAEDGWPGASPGNVHPRCRCFEQLVRIR